MTFEKKDRSENFGCSKTHNPTPVSLSLHKSTLDFLTSHTCLPAQGNHLRRLRPFAAMVCSCVRSKSSTLEGISQPEVGHQPPKSSQACLIQAKRWVCSKWTDWQTFFAPYARRLVAQLARSGQLLLVIDGSATGRGCATLMVWVVWGRYALPLAWITRRGAKGHFTQEAHIELLSLVESLLPPQGQGRVVLLGDGEFDGLKLRQYCRTLGWEYVLRTATDTLVECGGQTAPIGQFYPQQGEYQVFLPMSCQGDNAVVGAGLRAPRPATDQHGSRADGLPLLPAAFQD